LSAAGFEILNDVVLNQMLVSFGEPSRTQRVIEAVQQDGRLLDGRKSVGTWHGHSISVCKWEDNR
jgi:hypothetical protein